MLENCYKNKISIIRNKINKFNNSNVKIIAVTKYQTCDQIIKIKDLNIDGYGENKIQDLIKKKNTNCFLNHPIHFIGHVQTNKVKKLIDNNVDLIQSIDSIKIVDKISKYCESIQKIQKILIQVKFDNSLNRFGIYINELESFLSKCSTKKFIKIKGLMCMPEKNLNIKNKYLIYDKIYKVFIDINKKKYNNTDMDILSMGTSHDFEIAVSCGSTMVRIGTDIFN